MAFKRGIALSVIGVLLSAYSAVSYGAVPASFSGTWSGSAIQNNSTSWSILLALSDDEIGAIVGSVAYPSLGCGGTLRLESVASDSITLFEEITFGAHACVDEVSVTLTIASHK